MTGIGEKRDRVGHHAIGQFDHDEDEVEDYPQREGTAIVGRTRATNTMLATMAVAISIAMAVVQIGGLDRHWPVLGATGPGGNPSTPPVGLPHFPRARGADGSPPAPPASARSALRHGRHGHPLPPCAGYWQRSPGRRSPAADRPPARHAPPVAPGRSPGETGWR